MISETWRIVRPGRSSPKSDAIGTSTNASCHARVGCELVSVTAGPDAYLIGPGIERVAPHRGFFHSEAVTYSMNANLTPRPTPADIDAIGPMYAQCNGVTCRVRIWSEREWACLAESERPIRYGFFPHLGWVGLVPDPVLNH